MSSGFIKAYKILMLAILVLIALGGGVRAMNAGLSCPDWPLCFGDIIPDYHPQVYFEFIHRVLAGLIGITLVVFNVKVIKSDKVTVSTKSIAFLALLLLGFQIVMGGLTVLWQIQAKVVTIHLMSGMSLFALTSWIYFNIAYDTKIEKDAFVTKLNKWSILPLLVVFVQILLGGLVASHYAALVCVDFPLCHGKFIPTLKGTIGLQVIHRLGAYTTLIVLLIYFFFGLFNAKERKLKNSFKWIGIVISIQFIIGILNVILHTPPVVTVLHLTLGAVLLWLCLRVFFLANPFQRITR